jgi:hypothetical protein
MSVDSTNAPQWTKVLEANAEGLPADKIAKSLQMMYKPKSSVEG